MPQRLNRKDTSVSLCRFWENTRFVRTVKYIPASTISNTIGLYHSSCMPSYRLSPEFAQYNNINKKAAQGRFFMFPYFYFIFLNSIFSSESLVLSLKSLPSGQSSIWSGTRPSSLPV